MRLRLDYIDWVSCSCVSSANKVTVPVHSTSTSSTSNPSHCQWDVVHLKLCKHSRLLLAVVNPVSRLFGRYLSTLLNLKVS